MAMKPDKCTLFDELESFNEPKVESAVLATHVAIVEVRLAAKVWREVPQALFESWSDARQLSYCAARDEDSARTASERGEDGSFYSNRARMYRG